jgi:hypothetical protein
VQKPLPINGRASQWVGAPVGQGLYDAIHLGRRRCYTVSVIKVKNRKKEEKQWLFPK